MTRARSTVFTTIHVAISPRNRKMNGHDPPKRATLSATRSPRVRVSCAFLKTGCAGSWRRDHGYSELLLRVVLEDTATSVRDIETSFIDPRPSLCFGGVATVATG